MSRYNFPSWNRNRVIINNYGGWGAPIMMPHCHHSNPWLKTLGYMAMGNFFLNGFTRMLGKEPQTYQYQTPMYDNYSMYPGLSLSRGNNGSYLQTTLGNNNNYESYMQEYNDLIGIQQSYGTKFNISKIGEKFYAVSKDGKTQLSADTTTELMQVIGQYIEEKANNNDADDVETAEIRVEGDDDITDDDVVVDTDSDSDSDSDSDIDTDDDPPTTIDRTGWYKSSNANSETYEFTLRELKEAGNPAEMIADTYYTYYKYSKVEIFDAIIKNNPTIFNEDGTLKDNLTSVDNLYIPTKTWVQKNITNTALGKNTHTWVAANSNYTKGMTLDQVYDEIDKTIIFANSLDKEKVKKMILGRSFGAFDKDNKLVNPDKLMVIIQKEYSNGSIAKQTYTTNVKALKYLNGNEIYNKTPNSSSDDDAIFKIGEHTYTLSKNGKKLDYDQITGQRTSMNNKRIDPQTGKFISDNWFNSTTKTYDKLTFNAYNTGNGPLVGCYITYDAESKQVVLVKDEKKYNMNDVMTGVIKIN